MSLLEYTNGVWHLELEHNSDNVLNIVEQPIKGLIEGLVKLHDKSPLSSFSVTKSGNKYLYSFTGIDGRVWNQVIKKENGTYPMNFDVPDYWLLEEFSLHRDPRIRIITLIKDFNLQRIELTFTQ